MELEHEHEHEHEQEQKQKQAAPKQSAELRDGPFFVPKERQLRRRATPRAALRRRGAESILHWGVLELLKLAS